MIHITLSKIFWIVVALVVAASFGFAYSSPVSEAYKGLVALPGVAGLAVALFQIVRDNATHQRSLKLQEEQQLFNIGATSHMANTVFDRHVEFCEKYLSEVHQTVVTLTREGPTQNALTHVSTLQNLRFEYTAWITPEIDEKLMPFEQAVRNIGANSVLVNNMEQSHINTSARSNAIQEMHDVFVSVMGLNSQNADEGQTTVLEIKNRIREILQINQLVKTREYLINRASSVATK